MNNSLALACGLLAAATCLAVEPVAGASHPKLMKAHVTFASDVAPILYGKCANCHHSGEVAPFSLTSYADARSKAQTIAAVVEQRYMPPWQAVSHGEFENERTLSVRQIEILKQWAAEGAPAGDLRVAPPAPKFNPDWRIGKPDLIVEPSADYHVTADGKDEYRCFVVPTHFDHDRYVTASEIKPGDRRVVHHIIVYVDTSGTARKLDGKDGKPGYASFGGPGFSPSGTLGGWAPGLQPIDTPPGTGMWLPKGADIVLQVHYHKDGKPEVDRSRLALKFASAPVDKRVRWEPVSNILLSIPAGSKRAEVTGDLTLTTPITLLDVIPHMHLLGHDMRVTATLPDGTTRELIKVDHYDFNWQTRYTYRKPIHLPKGTCLNLVAHYDNSSDNDRNPNSPPKPVWFGEQTTDEMCFAFFSFTLDEEHLTKGHAMSDDISDPTRSATASRLFDRFNVKKSDSLGLGEMTDFVKTYRLGGSSLSKSQPAPGPIASYLIGVYGKARKGAISRSEFVRMVVELNS